jgi:hypothetical protein
MRTDIPDLFWVCLVLILIGQGLFIIYLFPLFKEVFYALSKKIARRSRKK